MRPTPVRTVLALLVLLLCWSASPATAQEGEGGQDPPSAVELKRMARDRTEAACDATEAWFEQAASGEGDNAALHAAAREAWQAAEKAWGLYEEAEPDRAAEMDDRRLSAAAVRLVTSPWPRADRDTENASLQGMLEALRAADLAAARDDEVLGLTECVGRMVATDAEADRAFLTEESLERLADACGFRAEAPFPGVPGPDKDWAASVLETESWPDIQKVAWHIQIHRQGDLAEDVMRCMLRAYQQDRGNRPARQAAERLACTALALLRTDDGRRDVVGGLAVFLESDVEEAAKTALLIAGAAGEEAGAMLLWHAIPADPAATFDRGQMTRAVEQYPEVNVPVLSQRMRRHKTNDSMEHRITRALQVVGSVRCPQSVEALIPWLHQGGIEEHKSAAVSGLRQQRWGAVDALVDAMGSNTLREGAYAVLRSTTGQNLEMEPGPWKRWWRDSPRNPRNQD